MRCSRTDLNGGEREQEHVIGASEEGLQARANLNGGELDEGPILPDGERGKMCHEYEIREQRREEEGRQAKKQRRRLKSVPGPT